MATTYNIIPPTPLYTTPFITDGTFTPGWQAWFNSIVAAPAKIQASATPLFSNIQSGINTTALMQVGSGAEINAIGTGIIAATSAPASGITGGQGVTEATSDVLIFGGNSSNAFLKSFTIQVQKANNTQDGYLLKADWNTFNGKQNAIASLTVPAHNFLNSWNGTSLGYAQPAFTDISGYIQASQLITPSLSTLGAIYSNAGATHKFVSSINTDGTVTLSQPAVTDISGGLGLTEATSNVLTISGGSNALLAATTITVQKATASAPGYLASADFTTFAAKQAAISSITVPAHNFLNSWNGTTLGYAQPAFSDISGTATATQLPSTTVNVITNDTNVTGTISSQNLSLGWTGTLAAGRLNSNVVQAITNDTNVTGSITSQNLTLGFTGTLAIGRGGTGQSTANAAYNALSPMTTLGDIEYFSTVAARLAGNTSTTRKFLSSTGTGTISAAPAWNALAGTDLPVATTSTYGGFQDFAAVTNKFAVSSASGIVTLAQPAFSNLSGSIASTQIPAPTTSTFGGFKDFTAVAHQFAVSSSSGVISLAQPAFSDISGTATAAQLPSTAVNSVSNDTNVTGSISSQALTLGWTGTLAVSRGGIGASSFSSAGLPTLSANNTFTGYMVVQGASGLTLSNANAATSSNNYVAPAAAWNSNYWNGSASAIDQWYWATTLGTGSNPTTQYALAHSGGSGAASIALTGGPVLVNTTTNNATDKLQVNGTTLTTGLHITSGTNTKTGSGTLSSGTVTISNTNVTANSFIYVTPSSNSANSGVLAVTTVTAGTSFIVKSSNSSDANTFKYLIIETA